MTRATIRGALFFIAVLCSRFVWAADFDCRSARTDVEKLICATPELSAMDEDLGLLYRHLDLRRGDDGERAAQQGWLKQRNRCKDVQCVREAYVARIADLLGSPHLNLPEPAAMPMGNGKIRLKSGWVIDDRFGRETSSPCPELRDYLNRDVSYWWRYSSNLYMNYCTRAAVQGPVFQSPPWQAMNPGEHKMLIARLLRYRDEKANYFHGPHLHDDAYYGQQASKFVTDGGTIRLWTTHLYDELFDPDTLAPIFTPHQPQHFAELVFPVTPTGNTLGSSSDCNYPYEQTALFLLSDDLSGPLRAYAAELEFSQLRLYRGRPVLISPGINEFALIYPLPPEDEVHDCRFRFIKDLKD